MSMNKRKINSEIISNKRTNLFIVLSGIFLTNAILAEMIGVKFFSVENTFGFESLKLNIIKGYPLNFDISAGVVIWPIVFVLTDVINEYFGKKGVRKISFLTAAFIGYIFLIIYVVTKLPPAKFWLEVNSRDPSGNLFNINYAFHVIFRQGLGIIIGSLTAFLLSQLLDVFVFQQLRSLTGSKMIWLRATGSTFVSQLIDSFVVLYIAFYIFGNFTMDQILSVGFNQYIYKFIMAIVMTPLIYLAHFLIDRYLGEEESEQMIEEAASDRSFF